MLWKRYDDPKKYQLTAIADRANFHDPEMCVQTRRDLRETTLENLYFHLAVAGALRTDDVTGRKIIALARYECERRERRAAFWRAVWSGGGAVVAGAISALLGVLIERYAGDIQQTPPAITEQSE